MSRKSPRYLEVASKIQNEIDALGPNALLPTEAAYADRFGVSRPTVRVALDLLERSGRVTRFRGRGTIVCPAPFDFPKDITPVDRRSDERLADRYRFRMIRTPT